MGPVGGNGFQCLGGSGVGSAELGRGEGLTKSQLSLPLFLIRVRVTELKYVAL